MGTLDQATCVYHPGKAATSACKQCGKTTCSQCTVSGPTGTFCSTPCRTAHEARVIQAKGADGKARTSFFVRLRGVTGKIIFVVVVMLVAAWVTNFIYIPVLSEVVLKVRAMLGL